MRLEEHRVVRPGPEEGRAGGDGRVPQGNRPLLEHVVEVGLDGEPEVARGRPGTGTRG